MRLTLKPTVSSVSPYSAIMGILVLGCGDGARPGPQQGLEGDTRATIESRASQVCVSEPGTCGGFLQVTDRAGNPVAVVPQDAEPVVESRALSGAFQPAARIQLLAPGSARIDIALVADNSGSELGSLEIMQGAPRQTSHSILDRSTANRVGLVRVSTQSEVKSPLTHDAAVIDAAISDLSIQRGWTALWDGIKLGNDLLSAETAGALCALNTYRAVLAYTDGEDNRSDASVLENVASLKTGGVQTLVHTVAVGGRANTGQLRRLAESSGGEHRGVEDQEQLTDALLHAAAGAANATPISFRVAD